MPGWDGGGAYQVSEPVGFASVLGPHQLLKPVRSSAEVGKDCLSYLEDTMAVLRKTHTKPESKGNNLPQKFGTDLSCVTRYVPACVHRSLNEKAGQCR